MSAEIKDISTWALRDLKKEIEAELSKRHKAKEDEKCCCWTCGHCFHDDNAHPSRRLNRDGYKCMLWSNKGRIIETKHKAPSWCPLKSKDATIGDIYDSLQQDEKNRIAYEIAKGLEESDDSNDWPAGN